MFKSAFSFQNNHLKLCGCEEYSKWLFFQIFFFCWLISTEGLHIYIIVLGALFQLYYITKINRARGLKTDSYLQNNITLWREGVVKRCFSCNFMEIINNSA